MTSKGNVAPKKKEDALFDVEQQFVLRLPPGQAMALRHDVQSGAMNLKDKLAIELQPDMRHGKVIYGGEVLNAKLVDLPTIVESLKTTDRKTFYKTADISQMLICGYDELDSGEDAAVAKKKDKDAKYKWNHGITPPLKNVRKRRFRKTLKKMYQEQPDIEKEVKRLFRMDNEAIDVKWEVVIEDEKADNQETGGEKQVLAQGAYTTNREDKKAMQNLLEVAEYEIFGEVSSSSDEDELKDVNIMDSGEEDAGLSRIDTQESFMSADFSTQMTDMSLDGDTSELQARLQQLGQQLDQVDEQAATDAAGEFE